MEENTYSLSVDNLIEDYIPDNHTVVKEIFENYGFKKIAKEVIQELQVLLQTKNNELEIDPVEIQAIAYKGLRAVNNKVGTIENLEEKKEVKQALARFFNSYAKRLNEQAPSIIPIIRNCLRLTTKIEGYDEQDLFNHLVHFKEMARSQHISKIVNKLEGLPPTRFKTKLNTRQLAYLGELLKQYGIICRKNQFHGLFNQEGSKALIPVKCVPSKELLFMHFMYDVIKVKQLVTVEGASMWEAIKESFTDASGKVFEKKIRQYYNRESKKQKNKSLIDSDLQNIWTDFKKKFPDEA